LDSGDVVRTHGLLGTYVAGCHCPDCKEACRVEKAQRRLEERLAMCDTDEELFAVLGLRQFEETPWKRQAACREESPFLFFPPAGERPEARRWREQGARQVCAGCAVLDECRDFARRNREYGFWGGEGEEERAAIGCAPDMPIGNVARIAAAYKEGVRW
jgi:WhiB family transcriptional regulator, redox-sensing transcriptional regulator